MGYGTMVAFKADASLAKEGLVLSLRAYEQSVQGRRGGGEHKNELDFFLDDVPTRPPLSVFSI